MEWKLLTSDLDEKLPNLLAAGFALLCRHLRPGAASPLAPSGEMLCGRCGARLFLLCCLPRRGQEPALPGDCCLEHSHHSPLCSWDGDKALPQQRLHLFDAVWAVLGAPLEKPTADE